MRFIMAVLVCTVLLPTVPNASAQAVAEIRWTSVTDPKLLGSEQAVTSFGQVRVAIVPEPGRSRGGVYANGRRITLEKGRAADGGREPLWGSSSARASLEGWRTPFAPAPTTAQSTL